MNKGVTVEKSINKQFPNKSQLPDNFLYDFLRGYFEGNGSIVVYKNVTKENTCSLSFATTEGFAKGFSERVEKEFNITRYNDGRKGVNIVIGTVESAEIIFKMYSDAPKDQILERKYKKYLEYIHNIK